MKTAKKFMLVFTFVAVNLAACKTPDNRNENLPEIYVDLSKEQDFYDISTDIEPDFEIIALETDDQCMLGQIQKIVFANNQYYILNSSQICIYIFNAQGKFVTKLEKLGRGPGEYLSLTSFAVIGQDIWIFDNTGSKIMRYDANLMNTESIPLQSTILEIESLADNLLLSSNFIGYNKRNYQLYQYNTQAHKLTEYLEYTAQNPDILPIKKDRQFAKLNDSCLFIYSYCNLIYDITASGIEPKYRFKISQRYEDIPVTYNRYSEEPNVIRGISAINQTPNSIILEYTDQGRPKYAICNKSTMQCTAYKNTMQASALGGLLINDYVIQDNNLIACYNSHYLFIPMIFDLDKVKDAKVKKRFEAITSQLDEYDNPVIIKFRLKPDSGF
ncbi:BF3164 family lipoprotein [uncultured Alistipes sp.]|jgi:hypothetical protein|uniref:BF3164 family lipoprotein n=1 Tax=uncultured Alistipes sp. TaxID=538949 RepID=UPI0025929B87|nr:BF3164 family lipoprotein [uncultured Alistipes sp.]